MRVAEEVQVQIERPLSHELAHCRERIDSLKECFSIAGLINSSLEIEEVLERIMTTSRAILKAESCSLMLADEKSGDLVFEVAQGPVAHLLKGGFRIKKGQGVAGHVFETGEGLLLDDAYRDIRFNQEFDRRTGYRTRSLLCVPLKIKDRIIGVSQLINRVDGAPFNSEDEETLTLLCSQAAVAIENARMHAALLRKQQIESDLAFAKSIQLSFLPQDTPEIPGFRFKAHYQPALEVSGDFYDFIPLEDDRLGILIGDVSGKGVASALYMARLTSDFRFLSNRYRDPAQLVAKINDAACERSCRGMFATLFYMVLDPSRHAIEYVNAGHIPPFLWNHSEGRIEMLRDKARPPAGIIEAQSYSSGSFELRGGDCLLLSTDGLIEAKNPCGGRLGMESLQSVIMEGDSNVDGVYQRIAHSVKEFVRDCPQADDITMVLLGVEGP